MGERHAVHAAGSDRKIDVDFTLAIYNRTGKYFIGRDLLRAFPDRFGRIYYGPLPLRAVPEGLGGKILGRLQHIQIMSRMAGRRLRLPARPHGPRPLLHLDPLTVGCTTLTPRDAVLCHDVGPLTHPELFDDNACRAYRAIYRQIAETGPHVVFVSRATRDAFRTLYPGSRLRSQHVVYPALRSEVSGGRSTPVVGLDGDFLLTVGALGLRKNQLRCMAAFARSGLADLGVRYVLCGAVEPGADQVIEAAKRTPGVVLLSYVSDEQLAWLYEKARGFVLASLLEGFGIPVAEAIARGLIPLVTRGSVLEEVAGQGALDVDAEDEAEIAQAMRHLILMDESERSQRSSSLRGGIGRFTEANYVAGWRDALGDIAGQPDADRLILRSERPQPMQAV